MLIQCLVLAGFACTCKAERWIEQLASQFGTDKRREHHKYTDLYAMLFDPLREVVENITEVGVLYGHSVPMWLDYFPRATVHAIDRSASALTAAREFLNASGHTLRRVRLLLGSSKDPKALERFGIAHGTMDIVIDDGDHSPAGQERTLLTLWPIVKPGGYYIIEDMATGANRHSGLYDGKLEKSGSVPMVHNPSAAAYSILSNNHAIFVDTAVGHPSFRKWADSLRRPANQYQFAPIDTTNVVDHNSHLLVLRKRLHRGVPIPMEERVPTVVGTLV